MENWTGRQLPILEHINVSRSVARGNWTLIFYHDDCEKCREVISKIARSGRELKSVILVEVPPFAGMTLRPQSEWEQLFVHGKLASSRRWVVETPQILRVENGIVIRSGVDFQRIINPPPPAQE